MSSFASFYLLTNKQLKELRGFTEEIPKLRLNKQTRLVAVEDEEEPQGPSPYDDFWDYLHKNCEEPIEFKWSGEILDRALIYLKEQDLDLTKSRFDTGNDLFAWLLFDKKVKSEFFEQLNPKHFTAKKVNKWLEEFYWGTPVESVMDGIRTIHSYLELVDDAKVVIVNTDYLASAITHTPSKAKKSKKQTARMVIYLCNDCGPRFGNSAKRIADTLEEAPQVCGTQFITVGRTINGELVEYIMDATMRVEGLCKAKATGYYRRVL
ncbi:MAG: hypothetical protein DKT66_16755 [Candidatus Melainabacteria bacterium]|nr:MAG: hypothetical protein DKT66_16755 [Candidatus Melainabacteria bacterium]